MPKFRFLLANGKKASVEADDIESAKKALEEDGQSGFYFLAPKEAEPLPEKKEPPGFLEKLQAQVFPSLKNYDASNSTYNDDLRLLMESLGYPSRVAGGVLNMVMGNPRNGDYGESETYEESGEGYSKYKAPGWIPGIGGEEFSPMGEVQRILHDPMNAMGFAAGKIARPAAANAETLLQLLRESLKHGAQGAAMEAARPAAMGTDLDPGEVAKGALGTVAGGLFFEGLSKPIKAALRSLRKANPGQYEKLLGELAQKNKVKPEDLDIAASQSGREGMLQNAGKESEIADKILSYRGFDEAKLPEYGKVEEFLKRSKTKVKPEDVEDVLINYEKRVRDKAGGGGLTSEEEAVARNLKREAEILYNEPPPAKKQAKQAREVREMDAAQINNARQRIGTLLDDDWKRMSAGRPDAEASELKEAYHLLRKHLMGIAEREGEEEAVKAYKTLAGKLGSREALFEAFGIKSSKYAAGDNLSRKLNDIAGNPYKRNLQEFIKDFDENWGTDIFGDIRYMNAARRLGARVENGKLVLKPDNNHYTGKGFRIPVVTNAITDHFTGGTVASAAKKLENAKRAASVTMGEGGANFPPVYKRPEQNAKQELQQKIMGEINRIAEENADELRGMPESKRRKWVLEKLPMEYKRYFYTIVGQTPEFQGRQ